MSFLAPLFLLGTAAIVFPIIFHLIRRTTRTKVPFSSLMFLAPTPPRVTRRNRLENLWLLLLRCLVLGLLAFGFARPFWNNPLPMDQPLQASKRVLLLVDRSASMRRGHLWEQACRRAESELGGLGIGDRAAVMVFGDRADPVVTFEQWTAMGAGERVGLSVQRLREVQPGWSGTSLGPALLAGLDLIEEEEAGASDAFGDQVRQIILISDLQEGSRLDGLQGYEWPRGMRVKVEVLESKIRGNAGLQLVAERDETALRAVAAGPRVRVQNASDSRNVQFRIGWRGAGSAEFRGDPVEVHVPSGQSYLLSAPEAPAGAGGAARLELAMTGDEVDFDNRVYYLSPRAEELDVWYLGGENETDPQQLFYYLKRAVQTTARQVVHLRRPALTATGLTGLTNSAPALIILTDEIPEAGLGAIGDEMPMGGLGLFVLTGADGGKKLARLLGMGELRVSEAGEGSYAMLGEIDFMHPVFRPFADPRFSDFTKIHFWKHRRVETVSVSGSRVLARFDRGDPFLVEAPLGSGLVLIMASSWRPGDSQLALSTKFVPMIYALMELMRGEQTQRVQYQVGEEVGLPSGLTGAGAVRVRKPDGREAGLSGTRFRETDLPGLYEAGSGGGRFTFAVNVPPEESRTAPMLAEDLTLVGVPLAAPETTVSGTKTEQQRRLLHQEELENRQKLWRWVLVAAMVFLLVETWAGGWLARRQAVAREAA